jgi:hypothetical protein
MDILSILFFLVAGAWLLVALFYSFLVLLFLRMRARGELGSIYDEDFGRVYLCCGCYLPCGSVFRRYARHLQLEEENGRSNSASPIRFMTRHERRAAMEALLLDDGDGKEKEKSAENEGKEEDELEIPPGDAEDRPEAGAHPTGVEEGGSDAGPVCSICLADYETTEQDDPESIKNATPLQSKTCPHQFHQGCILDWLQRQANTDCPCCRVAMVSEDDVWEAVQKIRKARRRRQRRGRRKGRRSNSTSGETNEGEEQPCEENSETERYDISETERDDDGDEEVGEQPSEDRENLGVVVY